MAYIIELCILQDIFFFCRRSDTPLSAIPAFVLLLHFKPPGDSVRFVSLNRFYWPRIVILSPLVTFKPPMHQPCVTFLWFYLLRSFAIDGASSPRRFN